MDRAGGPNHFYARLIHTGINSRRHPLTSSRRQQEQSVDVKVRPSPSVNLPAVLSDCPSSSYKSTALSFDFKVANVV